MKEPCWHRRADRANDRAQNRTMLCESADKSSTGGPESSRQTAAVGDPAAVAYSSAARPWSIPRRAAAGPPV